MFFSLEVFKFSGNITKKKGKSALGTKVYHIGYSSYVGPYNLLSSRPTT